MDYFSGMQRINIGETVSNLFNKRGYMPTGGSGSVGGHVVNMEKTTDHHNHYQNEQMVMRRPFEDIQSHSIRTELVSNLLNPVSHLRPMGQIVIPAGKKPSIRFNISTKPSNTVILPRETPLISHVTQIIHPQSPLIPYIHQNSAISTVLPPT